jgi:hypothetical protein
MKDSKYKLVNTLTGKVVSRAVLNCREANTFNYAYALNGAALRWRLA